LGHVLVAAAGEVDDDQLLPGHFGGALDDGGEGVGGFQGGNDALQAGEADEGVEGLGIGGEAVFDAALIAQPGVLRADGGVIEAGGDAVG